MEDLEISRAAKVSGTSPVWEVKFQSSCLHPPLLTFLLPAAQVHPVNFQFDSGIVPEISRTDVELGDQCQIEISMRFGLGAVLKDLWLEHKAISNTVLACCNVLTPHKPGMGDGFGRKCMAGGEIYFDESWHSAPPRPIPLTYDTFPGPPIITLKCTAILAKFTYIRAQNSEIEAPWRVTSCLAWDLDIGDGDVFEWLLFKPSLLPGLQGCLVSTAFHLPPQIMV
ncbi:hypothetical protein ARMGADRAFT_1029249 [Armillaria gallica]|uniref:Uncharacterized protein n=1 Tax=Armillaria gallica TaxID=47427 RepID=A0A2H3DI53_ARMGA|nr:hypothetical protein ARMGADRAFT_1029249 [Armillaria gallica]